MKTVHVTWLQKQQYVGVDSSKHSVVMSTQDAENGIGMKPAELLLVAFGGCTSVDVVSILEKKRQPLTGLEVVVSGEQESDPPYTFRKIHVTYRVRGRGLKAKAVEQAVELSEEKYCSVGATLRAAAAITHSIEILDETADAIPSEEIMIRVV